MTAETKKEQYLAYLNGDTTIVLPEPETKEERYLYDLCINGTGGGASSWDDLEDKPFKSVGNNLTVTSDGALTTDINVVAPLKVDVAPTALNKYVVALGHSATASGTRATAIGYEAKASGTSATAIGIEATSSGTSAIAIGTEATASNVCAIALGRQATGKLSNAIALGTASTASGSCSTALGNSSTASGSGSIALGNSSTASGSGSIALGQESKVTADDGNVFSIGNSKLTRRIIHVADPTDDTDAATKAYVDSKSGGESNVAIFEATAAFANADDATGSFTTLTFAEGTSYETIKAAVDAGKICNMRVTIAHTQYNETWVLPLNEYMYDSTQSVYCFESHKMDDYLYYAYIKVQESDTSGAIYTQRFYNPQS